MRWTRRVGGTCGTVALLGLLTLVAAAGDKPLPGLAGKLGGGPLTPREELATFKVPKGFRVELVACEPDIVDPVAMAFDEDGRLFVAEMPGYPNGGVGTGTITSGRIKLLDHGDDDRLYEKSSVCAAVPRYTLPFMPFPR